MMPYPRRPSFFAQKFIRLLIKTAAAQSIGPDGFSLLTIVATTEDARRYSGPVRYYNQQLLSQMGVGSHRRLIAARQRCIDEGWLAYQPGGKSVPGSYFVLVPDAVSAIPDGPSDESGGICASNLQAQADSANTLRFQNESASVAKAERNRQSNRPTPLPIPAAARAAEDAFKERFDAAVRDPEQIEGFKRTAQQLSKSAGRSLDRDEAWSISVAGELLLPGFCSETATKIRSREIKKPRQYIHKVLQAELAAKSLDWCQVRQIILEAHQQARNQPSPDGQLGTHQSQTEVA